MSPREKLENDIRQWLQSRLIGNEVYETIISWLDRQAEITAQVYGDWIGKTNELQAKVDELTEVRDELLIQLADHDGDCYCGATSVQWYEHSMRLEAKVDELTNERDELQARVDGLQAKIDRQREELNKKNEQVRGLIEERDRLEDMTEQLSEEVDNQRINYTIVFARAEKAEDALADLEKTHIKLPVDADGVPIRIGDTMERVCAEVPGTFIVGLIGADGHCMDDETSFFIASECRHVQPDTIDGIIAEAMSFACEPEAPYSKNSKYVKQYAERIRKAVEQ